MKCELVGIVSAKSVDYTKYKLNPSIYIDAQACGTLKSGIGLNLIKNIPLSKNSKIELGQKIRITVETIE